MVAADTQSLYVILMALLR